MRKTLLSITTLLFYLQIFAQFPIHMLMPLGVNGISLGDTMLNSSIVLRREKIRKVTTDQTTIQDRKKSYHHAEYDISDGLIRSNRFCFHRSVDSGFCNVDTFIYDSNGRLLEFREMTVGGGVFLQQKLDYTGEGRITETWISKSANKAESDTDVYLCFYNRLGQLTRKEMVTKRFISNDATLYYNQDGLIDSIDHDNSSFGTYVFKRKQKGNNKEIHLDTKRGSFKWTYNSAGQCISSEWRFTPSSKPNNKSNERQFHKASFTYNPNGTLSKVVEKASNKRVTTTIYTYQK